MKTYLNFINEEYLLEEVAGNQFAFGFEFEAYVRSDSDLDKMLFDGLKKYDSKGSILEKSRLVAYERLLEFLMKDILGSGFPESDLIRGTEIDPETKQLMRIKEKIDDDGSLKHRWKHLSFEFKSPVFPHTKAWVRHIINCLQKWIASGDIFTDIHCGFHNHISYNGMTEEDRTWIYVQMAKDSNSVLEKYGKMKEKYGSNSSLITNGKTYEFLNELYSSSWQLLRVKSFLKYKDFFGLRKQLVSEKNNLFHLHTQGTIEWRGPRNFMDTELGSYSASMKMYNKDEKNKGLNDDTIKNGPQSLRNIQQFYTLMVDLIRSIIKYEKKTTIVIGEPPDGEIELSKKEFFEKLNNNDINEEMYHELLPYTSNLSKFSFEEKSKASRHKIINNKGMDIFVLKEYHLSGTDMVLNSLNTTKILLNDCDVVFSDSIKMSGVRCVGCEFDCFSNMILENCSYENSSIVIATNTKMYRNKINNCIFDEKTKLRCNVSNFSCNDNAEYTDNTFNCDVNVDCIRFSLSTVRFIKLLFSENNLNKNIFINAENKSIKYDPETYQNNWIGNDEKYSELLKQMRLGRTFSMTDLMKL